MVTGSYVTMGPKNFPWLKAIANNYDEYKYVSISFDFKPVCPTTTNGLFMMFYDYDRTDPVPTNINTYYN